MSHEAAAERVYHNRSEAEIDAAGIKGTEGHRDSLSFRDPLCTSVFSVVRFRQLNGLIGTLKRV